VRVIDSSAFPHIPAGPVTFSVMANAARIASSVVPDLEAVDTSMSSR
jgi:choline dehydrogenase-like flavoprotein